MGLETVALVAFTALQAGSAYSQGEAEAKAIARKGTLDAKNKAKETVYKAANLRQSFLSGGLTMEGTPMSVINETIATGREDVLQIVSNANQNSKNAISAGRNAALTAVGKSFAMASMGGMFEGGAGPESVGSFDGLPNPSSYGLTSAGGAGFNGGGFDWTNGGSAYQGTGGVY